MKHCILYILAVFILFTGCEFYEQDEYQENYVVESYLVAGDELPIVRLSKTSSIDETYNFQELAVTDASVEIQLLDDDSTAIQTFGYQQAIDNVIEPGIYHPQPNVTVQPEQLYRLHITHEGNEITSTTYVPGNFESVNELQDQYTYQSENQIEVNTTPSSYITGRQSYYIFTVNAFHTSRGNLTPFYLDLVEDQDAEIENFYINSSGIINEENYERNEDDTITLQVPWLAIAFYGENYVIANAIDDNMYDFLRTQDVQTGGTTLSPGEIQNVKYNVEGGIGIFGSMASDTSRVEVLRPNP